MSDEETSDLRRWVACWKRAGPELERIRREELRRFRYEDHVDLIDSLLDLGCQHAMPRKTSGLVQQQRLFQKLRK